MHKFHWERAAVAVLVLLSLSACSLLPESFAAYERGAADAVVDSSERALCRDIPVGTWQRRYGHTAERTAAWRALCIPASTTPTPGGTP